MQIFNNRNFYFVTGIISGILLVIFIILGATTPYDDGKSSDNPSIIISNDFEIASNVQNAISQTYLSKITGSIKNISENELSNITLIFEVKTSYLQHQGTLEINIDKLASNKEYYVSTTLQTNENFEEIIGVYAKVENGSSFKLSKDIPSSMNPVYAILIVFSLIICIVCFVIWHKKKQNQITDLENQIKVEKLKSELSDVTGAQKEITELENDLKKERIKAELKALNQKEPQCPYCGCKNKPDAIKCVNCGASITNEDN